ncbi:hypothetical protein JCM11641_004157 [Rhodosporidiobolus odoratus]
MTRTAVCTVGSTSFQPLVDAILSPDVLADLPSLGVSTVLVQVGNGTLPSGWRLGDQTSEQGLHVEIVQFAPDIEDRVGRADLVVSHAGAGSILSFLRPLPLSIPLSPSRSGSPPVQPRRQLVLVPNSTLMDSHQLDLADEMRKKGWAVVCEQPDKLAGALEQLATEARVEHDLPAPSYPPLQQDKVQRILDDVLGFD